MKTNIKYLHMLLIFFLSFIVYFNTFFNPFIFDDKFFIVDNFKIRSLNNIPSYFSEPSVGDLYRPMRSVLYSIVFFIWDFNTFGYHLNAILLHTFISILVYLIIFEIIPNRHFSLIVSLLFVAHPIHTERVVNMTAGFDLLGILFLFWAFYNYVIFRKYNSNRAFAYSIVLFIFGLFSSEEAIVFPFLALLYDFCFVEGENIFGINSIKSKLKYFWIYIVPLLFYLAVRFYILKQIGRAKAYFLGNLQTRILSTLMIFLRYIYTMIFPFQLTVDYYVKLYKSFSMDVILILSVYLLLILFWVKSYRNHKVAFFSIGWFFITLMPFSNIFPIYLFMADRYLYVASFGFLFLLAYLLDKLFNFRFFAEYSKYPSKYSKILHIITIIIIVFLIVLYSSLTIIRNSEWKSDYTLLSKAVERQPKSSNAHNNLGEVYWKMGLYDKAFDKYKESIILNNKNHIAWLNLGVLYGDLGNYREAIYSLNKSLAIFESYNAYNTLGLIYDRIAQQEMAIVELKKAINLNPSLTKAHMDLGIVYAKMGKFDMAFEELNRALKINPEIADIHYNLGILYEFLNQTANASREFGVAYKLEPGNKQYRDKFLYI